MSNSFIKNIRLFAALVSLILLPIIALSSMLVINKLLTVLLLALFLISLFNFKLGFLLILFLRPILDLSVNNILFTMGSITVNMLSLLGFIVVLLSSLFIFIQKPNWRRLPHNYLFLAWFFFLILGVLSIFNTFYLGETVKELFRYFSILSSFLVGFFLLRDAKDLSLLIKVIIWSALAPAILGLFQIMNKTGLPDGQIYRAFGSFTHPNMLAFFLILAITMSIFLILNIRKDRLEVYIYSLLSIFYILILFFTYTRGAYLALLAILFLIGAAKFRKFLLFGFVFLIILYILIPPVQVRFNSIFQSDPYGSVAWRFDLWRDSYGYLKERPVQGYGLGTAATVISVKRDFRLGPSEPHNDYLQIALDGGYPLLIAYIILIFSLLIAFWRSYWQEHRPRLKNFFLFFAALCISIFAMSSGDNILNDTSLQWQLWALAGASLACANLKSDFQS